jgi:hypothetical protein
MAVGDPEATARLVALAMQRLGLDGRGGAGKLARLIGMPPYSEGSIGLVHRWLKGVNAPRAEYMLEMLSQAGLLTPEADRAWRGEPLDPRAAARAVAEAAARRAEEAIRRQADERPARRGRGSG